MSKNILGLDLGTTSIGWALVKESEKGNSEIIKLGVRENPLTVDEKTNFEKGRPLTTNAERTLKRSARRNLQRFKLRRENLIEILLENHIIKEHTLLAETGKNSTYTTLKNRAKAAKEQIELEDFARILLSINKKRGYKSSRKSKNIEEGVSIDGMQVAKTLYENNLTPGEFVLNLLKTKKKYIPDFYRSDLLLELKRIWETQKDYYPDILTNNLFSEIQGKNKSQTWAICAKPFQIKGISQKGKPNEKRYDRYLWRSKALKDKLDLELLAIVLQEINNDLGNSSGYLGDISDRSKHLYFNNITVGEYLYELIKKDKHCSLKNKVFYRQDYLDEFEKIWEQQAKYYPILTNSLKEKIRDVIIFYQRKLKSQKGLIDICTFENKKQTYIDSISGKSKTRVIGPRVCPKSSPLFQEFKIWQNLNILSFENELINQEIKISSLDKEIRQHIFEELNLKGDLKPNDILNILSTYYNIGRKSSWKCNLEKVEGNNTNQNLFKSYKSILENEGYGFEWKNKKAASIKDEVQAVFTELGINTDILYFNALEEGKKFERQSSFKFWHLLYSSEDDDKITSIEKEQYGIHSVKLKKNLHLKFGFKPEYASLISNVNLQEDYSSLSTKAIRNILPHLKEGHNF